MITLSLAETLYLVVLLVVAVVILDEERDPDTTLAWIVVLLALPGLGLVLYFFVGRNWRRIRRHSDLVVRIKAMAREAIGPTYAAYDVEARALVERVREGYGDRLIGIIEAQTGSRPLPCEEFRIITSGAEKFDALLEDISSAGRFVHLQYFIWERDGLTSRVTEALIERLAAGVEVRILYDYVGSLFHSNAELELLKRHGAQVVSNVRSLAKLNYRDHLKIVVVDGGVAYTGGMNMGEEYIDGGSRFDSWRDTHVRVTGPFVAELQQLFAQRWYEERRESVFDPRYFPEPGTGADGPMLQLVFSSVDSRWEAVRQAFLLAIAKAEERVWVQSPYFVPDQTINDALVASALSGVDVRIMMTGVPDKRSAFWAAQAYYPRVLEAGARIFRYDAGFFHAKAMSIDGLVSVFGTTNFDIRSFSLHNEASIFVYDRTVTSRQERIFEADLAYCTEVTAEELARVGALVRFRNAAARLGSRLL